VLEQPDSHLREGRSDYGARGFRGVVWGISVLEEGIASLSKPFDLRDLTRTVRGVLDSRRIEREAVPGTERSPG
jgi:hypothetical protein